MSTYFSSAKFLTAALALGLTAPGFAQSIAAKSTSAKPAANAAAPAPVVIPERERIVFLDYGNGLVQNKLLASARKDPIAAITASRTSGLTAEQGEDLRVAILIQLTETAPEKAFALLAEGQGVDRAEAGKAMAFAWGQRDPKSALSWLDAQPSTYNRYRLVASALEGWAEVDSSSAMEAAAVRPMNRATEFVIGRIAKKWFRDDPIAAMEWVRKQDALDPLLGKAAIMALAPTSPEFAAEIFLKLPQSERDDGPGRQVVFSWARKDPAGCLAWLKSLPMNDYVMSSFPIALSAVARSSPEMVPAFLAAIPADGDRSEAVRHIVTNMADRKAALEFLMKMPDSTLIVDAFVRVLREETGDDQAKLMAWTGKVPPGGKQSAVYGMIAGLRFAQDPPKAIAWVNTLDARHANAIATEIGERWAERDPVTAAVFLKKVTPGLVYDRMARIVNGSLKEKDPVAAAEWAATLPQSMESERTVQSAFGNLARYKPEEVVRILQTMQPGVIRDRAAQSAMDILGESKPSVGVEVLMQYTPRFQQEDAAKRLTEGWSKHDMVGARAWIASLPAGKIKNGAVGGVVNTLSVTKPAEAVELSAQIANPNYRLYILRSLFVAWYATDPTAAKAALATLDFPADKRAELENALAGKER